LAQKEYPPDWWLKNWRYVDEQREQVRKRIIEEYGVDLQIPDWLEQLMVDARRRGLLKSRYLR